MAHASAMVDIPASHEYRAPAVAIDGPGHWSSAYVRRCACKCSVTLKVYCSTPMSQEKKEAPSSQA